MRSTIFPQNLPTYLLGGGAVVLYILHRLCQGETEGVVWGLGSGFGVIGDSVAVQATWRFMDSHKCSYTSANIGYNYSYPTYKPTYNYP